MKGVFVTGTDTGVGKTAVTAVLTALLRGRGVDAVPAKPVQTGARGALACRRSSDLTFCLRVARVRASRAEQALMAPYLFRHTCSPHLAAREERRVVRIACIVRCLERLGARHELVVVEGAGGVRVPLGPGLTNVDLIVRLGLPAVVAARPGLGTINHTLLTVDALRRAGVRVLGVVFVQTSAAPWGLIESDNGVTIQREGHVRVLGRIPHVGDGSRPLSPGRLRAMLPGCASQVRALVEAVMGLPGVGRE